MTPGPAGIQSAMGANVFLTPSSTNSVARAKAVVMDWELAEDTQHRSLPDDWQLFFFGNLDHDAAEHFNGDGLTLLAGSVLNSDSAERKGVFQQSHFSAKIFEIRFGGNSRSHWY